MAFDGGYMGTILHIDLTTGRVRRERLEREAARAFIGGYGFNMKLAYELIPPGVDPLDAGDHCQLSAAGVHYRHDGAVHVADGVQRTHRGGHEHVGGIPRHALAWKIGFAQRCQRA